MKKLIMPLLAICLLNTLAFAQKGDYVKRSTLGVHFFFNDFQTPKYIRSTSLSQTFRDDKFGKIKDMDPGLAINFMKGLTNTFDFSTTLAGSFLDYPIDGKKSFGNDHFLLEGDAMIHAKMFSDKYVVSPYLSAGVGVSSYYGYWGAFLPVGVGLQVNLFDDAFLMINSQYRMKISDNTNYHFYHSIGFAGNIGPDRKPKVIPPPPPPIVIPPKDTDGDGIIDDEDACPTVFGIKALNGCPDRDGDGIADKDDKCPDVAGLARYQGCPIPDTDGDGINDEEDKCPTVAGLARYQGCPIPDTDGDGINDEEDKCKNTPGLPDNFGCPEMVFYYKRDGATLSAEDKANLDKLVVWMGNHPDLGISIEGHTSTLGATAYNQKLSEKRAQNSVKYLVSKGIDASRLKAVGYGEQFPIGDNSKEEGRALSRRVVMRIAK